MISMKKYALTTLSLVLCFFILTSFETMTAKGKPKKQKSGVTLTNLDRTVLPNVDFYQFVMATSISWVKTTRSSCRIW